MQKELFPGSTGFTEAIFKIPQISKHFSAMPNCVRCPVSYRPLYETSQTSPERRNSEILKYYIVARIL